MCYWIKERILHFLQRKHVVHWGSERRLQCRSLYHFEIHVRELKIVSWVSSVIIGIRLQLELPELAYWQRRELFFHPPGLDRISDPPVVLYSGHRV